MRHGALVVIAAGASASLVLPLYLTELRKRQQREIVVLLTRSAERFVPREVVGWLAEEVITSDDPTLNPVELALTSDGLVVLPATAHIVAAGAMGLASTPATTTLLAAPGPCLWFPHMNKVMWDKPVTQRHVATLRAAGETVVEPEARIVYEMWRGARGDGVSMVPPDKAAVIIDEWLDGRA
ncbi:flavoprotein [Nocardia sp. NPDC088792]|uniref:flavoprotein n=1 Tax=Nocardia sp. NPDC088792 TaxID=3364332 RepID=UPI0037FB29F9